MSPLHFVNCIQVLLVPSNKPPFQQSTIIVFAGKLCQLHQLHLLHWSPEWAC